MLRFLHIPKTAGTSFKLYIQKSFPEERFIEFAGHLEKDHRIYERIEGGRLRPRLVGGHAAIRTGISEIDELPTITFLREPIARVRSFCRHVAEGKSPYLLNSVPPSQFSLKRFLESGNFELCNLQTAMLTPGWNYHEKGQFHSNNIARAFEMLSERCVAFGLLEYLPESIFLISRETGLPLKRISRANSSSNVLHLVWSEKDLQTAKNLNAADIKLYEQAEQLFFHRLKELSLLTSIHLCLFRLHWKLTERLINSFYKFRSIWGRRIRRILTRNNDDSARRASSQ